MTMIKGNLEGRYAALALQIEKVALYMPTRTAVKPLLSRLLGAVLRIDLFATCSGLPIAEKRDQWFLPPFLLSRFCHCSNCFPH